MSPTKKTILREMEMRNQPVNVPTRDDFLKSLVQALVNRRLSLGLTQADVDYRMGNADRALSKWECGDRTPSSFNLFCWSEALGCRLVLLSHDDKV